MRLPMGPSSFKSVLVVVLLVVAAVAGEGARATQPTILPMQFAGWQMQGTPQTSADPAVADSINAALLKEYGFTDFESATFAREDGRNLTLKAARFADASGAYGAFTYYKLPQMQTEKIGDQGASLNERVLFYRGNVLVDAVFGKLTAMSAAELRGLAKQLPLPAGSARNLPGLPSYLPGLSYVKNTAKYVMGPVALEKVSAPLPEQIVDFNAGAEVVLGTYKISGHEATLMLISYPTPQIAAEHLRRIDVAHEQNTLPGAPADGPVFDRRTGPIVALLTGPISPGEAKSLLGLVNYDADVTWNENTFFNKNDNVGTLLVNIIILCAILIGFALVAGVAFGGIRLLVKRMLPERVFDRPEGMEFIALRLTERMAEEPDSKVSPSIKVG